VFAASYFTASVKALFSPRCILACPVKCYTTSRSKKKYNTLETKFTTPKYTASVGVALTYLAGGEYY
jgi:hypothetical protein